MNRLILIIPFGYFLITRLRNLKNLIFHSYFEWIPAVIILIALDNQAPFEAIHNFLLGYLAFISVYEIGYITNDHLSESREKDPRKRFDKPVSKSTLILLILLRLIVFGLITNYLNVQFSYLWWIFYLFLFVSFLMHNSISNSDYRLLTFFNLSVFRFYAPIFIFSTSENLQLILPVVLICYSFYRTLIYMDNKDLLNVKSRKNPLFNLSFHGVTIMVIGFYSVISGSIIPIIFATYFLIFTLIYFVKTKLFNG